MAQQYLAPINSHDPEKGGQEGPKHPQLASFRHRIYGVYQRLFSAVLILNLVGFIYVGVTSTSDLSSLSIIAIPIIANVFLAGLFRTDYFINLLYISVLWVPLSWPLWIRRRLANIYEFGGVHSGAGTASAIWAILFVVRITQAFVKDEPISVASIIITYFLVTLLVAIIGSAHPTFRRMQHNSFEAIHRFSGWLAVALFWALLMLLTRDTSLSTGQSFGHVLTHSPLIYFLVATTILIILPWLRLRRVPAEAVKLSDHATRIYFHRPKIGIVQGLRISESPLLEWHSFASIPNTLSKAAQTTLPDAPCAPFSAANSYSILVSAAGDWTKATIQRPLTHRKYWVRGIPVTGVALCALLFRRVVLVTTGTGIGPILSLLAGIVRPSPAVAAAESDTTLEMPSKRHLPKQTGENANKYSRRRNIPCRVIWSTPNPIATYGEPLVREVKAADPDAIIWDTRQHGRPDIVSLTERVCAEFDAEAVVCVSNPKVTDMVVYGMRSRGVPAHGPIFDS